MKYPEDFKEFTGKKLNPKEIDELLGKALADEHETLATGDTMVEIGEGEILIWKLKATGEIPFRGAGMTDIEQKFSEGVAREIFLGCWDGDRETGIQAWEDEIEMSREPYIKDAIKYLSLARQYYASLTPEQVREEIAQLIQDNSSSIIDNIISGVGKPTKSWMEIADQIVALRSTQVKEAEERERERILALLKDPNINLMCRDEDLCLKCEAFMQALTEVKEDGE